MDEQTPSSSGQRNPEIERLRTVYQARTSSETIQKRYARESPAQQYAMAAFKRDLAAVIRTQIGTLEGLDILNVGCGYGGFIDDLQPFGAEASRAWRRSDGRPDREGDITLS